MYQDTDYSSHLPPYRSLLSPDSRYDYSTHSLIPITQHELNTWYSKLRQRNNHNLTFQSLNSRSNNNTVAGLKMKYKSLLSDVSRSLSLRLSSSNLLANTVQNIQGVHTPSNLNTTVNATQSSDAPKLEFHSLPIEILDYVFFLVDNKTDYKSCLYAGRLFYFFAKPYYYESLHFTSTYRFAQFISYLRLNSEVGQYVKSIDLSGIRPGFEGDGEFGDTSNAHTHINTHVNGQAGATGGPANEVAFVVPEDQKVLAGWRDWKVKSYPLYSINSTTSLVSLTKVASNSQLSNLSSKSHSNKSLTSSMKKPFRLFRTNKRRRSLSSGGAGSRKSQKVSGEHELQENDEQPQINDSIYLEEEPRILARNATPHPHMNKFLLNYSTSKDVPIGYVLHLINLCPNVESLNLGGLSLSIDYEVHRSAMYKFSTFDLMHNYPKNLVSQVDDLLNLEEFADNLTLQGSILSYRAANASSSTSIRNRQQSSASSIYSSFPKPQDPPSGQVNSKYNSLLPPLPDTVIDFSYMKKGDGKVYLSDLNLKAINNMYLKKINEEELLEVILKLHGHSSRLRITRDLHNQHQISMHTLKYIELSSMIWLTRELVQRFLRSMIGTSNYSSDFPKYKKDYSSDYQNSTSFWSARMESVEEEISDSDLDDDSDSDSNSIESSTPRREVEISSMRQDLVIDLTNSGMYKNLQWAQLIDLGTRRGCKLAYKIMNNKVLDPFELRVCRARSRRGRIGENYLS